MQKILKKDKKLAICQKRYEKDMSQEIRFTKIKVNLHIIYTKQEKKTKTKRSKKKRGFIYIRKATQKS